MKEIEKFADVVGTPSGLKNALDIPGSSQDVVFAEAIIANEPTSILEENGIITVQRVPAGVDEIAFPVVRNTQFTWRNIDGRNTTNSLGSDLGATKLNSVEYVKVRPTIQTANIFLPDEVSLLNKVNFDLYARLGAVEAKRKKEEAGLETLTGTTASVVITAVETGLTNQVYAANGFIKNGSVTTGSTLTPNDLINAKRVLSTGSDINVPDFVIMHPEQYHQINTHSDFAPGATQRGAMLRKAKFNEDGDLVRFDGMDIFVSELVPTVVGSATTAYPVAGHPVVVSSRGKAVCRGEHMGIRVSTEDSRRRHGQWKIFDISYANSILVKEAIILLRASDD